MIATLKPGEIAVVNKLDRLGRSTRELLDRTTELATPGPRLGRVVIPYGTPQVHREIGVVVTLSLGEKE